jgi:retron-type reverse transcriptase
MHTYKNLYDKLCSFENLYLAYRKARKGKGHKPYVADFEFNLESKLFQLKHELESMTYQPHSLRQFVIRDPKTRLISASHFRDRIVHHALCNVIEPIFNSIFISDSYANRKTKGTLAAVLKFDDYKRSVSGNGKKLIQATNNNQVHGYVLKADIRHYFDSVDHEVLIQIIGRKIKDDRVLWLVKKILDNHLSEISGNGMPLGNMTSQFFANIYLNELDYFVKHKLKARYYIRYVDDFVILDSSKKRIEFYKAEINKFLKSVKLELHPEKSKILPLHAGINFLGYRIFYKYKLLKKSNLRIILHRIEYLVELCEDGVITRNDIFASLEGWNAYAIHANTYKIRKEMRKNLKKSVSVNPILS